ncbi:tRNA(Ile)-lysidine synthase [Pseudomonas matsuisoli]|uniref:tRNA(Ile)-lysidine synthetase n=1 Tax=Pseudomonas matsuisoli TaxID=1515666 RepID=A0A917USD9_9PSED|nr:tRNA(Ile)-lysidine synthase [Pseudomonas matsuisoli]
MDVPLKTVRVTVASGPSLEANARKARYAAFHKILGPDEVLMLAHHRDDQAETFLFRLFRGAGVRGLAGMPATRTLGRGHLFRPLLDISRQALLDEMKGAGIAWVEDPSNADAAMARNFLRHRLLPVAVERWPQARTSAARAAAHLAEAQGLLDELAHDDLVSARIPSTWPWLSLPSLFLPALATLSEPRQRNAMRHWLRQFNEQPDTEHWDGWRTLRDAQAGAAPVWRLKSGALHRSGKRVWWLSGEWLRFAHGGDSYAWQNTGQPLVLPGNGTLRQAGRESLNGALEVLYRQGGELLDIPGRGRRDLKRLFNESGLPVFVRARVPLVYRDGRLIAVANLPGLSALEAQGARFEWIPPTSDLGLS